MVKMRDPDIIVDECPACRGVFLDRGELDVVATGLAGGIEHSPVEHPFHLDRFPQRECPKCSDQKMVKVNLLKLPDLIFDHCPHCRGFYLDRGEYEAMNEALRKQAPNGVAQEFRGHQCDRLVRVDRVDHTEIEPIVEDGPILMSCHLRVSVYFHHPLAADVRILQNKMTTLFARVFGLISGKHVLTGDQAFDKIFRVYSSDKERVLDLLPQPFIEGLIAFAEGNPGVLGNPGELSLCRTSISYSEGPYSPEEMVEIVEKSQPIVEKLLNLADLVDFSSG